MTTTVKRPVIRKVGAAIGAAALIIILELVDSAPITAVAATKGATVAFVVLSPVYSVGNFALALGVMYAYRRYSSGKPSRLARWMEKQQATPRGDLGSKLLEGSKIIGFIVASILLGGALLTWLLLYSGRKEKLVPLAATSSAIFGITFTAMYAGLFGMIF